jgi:FkbM family methyltransferase
MNDLLVDLIGKFIRKFGYLPGLGRLMRFLNPAPVKKIISYSKSKIEVDTGHHNDWKIYYNGFYKSDVSRFILDKLPDFIGKNPACFDVGAGTGNLSILLAEICGDKGRVVSVEVNPDVFKRLKIQIKLNNLQNKIIAVNKAISDTGGSVYFHFPKENSFNILNSRQLVNGESGGVSVESVRFFSLMKDIKINKADFIRIDIQGFEPNFFKDNEDILIRDNPVISLSVSSRLCFLAKNSVLDIYDFLTRLEYKIYRYKLFFNKYLGRFYEVKRESIKNNLSGRGISEDWIAVHKSRKI